MSILRPSPLFHTRVLPQSLAAHSFPTDIAERHAVIRPWVEALRAGKLDDTKEVSLHGEFLTRVFGDALGYRGLAQAGAEGWELTAEKGIGAGGKSADAALGFFQKGRPGRLYAAIELKGAKQHLDRAMGRVLTPVQQAWDYANHSPGCRWIIVSNYRETRLYSTARTPDVYETFLLEKLEDLGEFKRFYYLLARETLLPASPLETSSPLDGLLKASERTEADITKKLYEEYRTLRRRLYVHLGQVHSNLTPAELLSAAQTVLDRVLFIAFAEDRGLVPQDTIKEACAYRDKYRPQPVWQNFQAVFRWVDKGNKDPHFPAYNGGLFRNDEILDMLEVSDDMCEELGRLARYDFRDDVSVDVLGHIFEQSISDLETIRAQATTGGSVPPSDPARESKRHSQGIYYTPAFITRYIVDRTLGRIFDERWQAVFSAREPEKRKSKEQRQAWIDTYEAYREELKKIQVLDPACGSGAFLVAAFDALGREYERVNAALAELREGQVGLFDLTKTVLNNNLFGVDLNQESVEITKLSLWLKTAERGKKLTYLDSNIKWGNSIVKDPDVDPVAFDWARGAMARSFLEAPAASDKASAAEIDARWLQKFDVVIGNPPYIRHELLSQEVKAHLETTYEAHHGMADIYVYFFERGLSMLTPGGRLGFIVANKWLRSGYAEKLRLKLARHTEVETVVDFGHARIFDADTFPCIIAVRKLAEQASPAPEHALSVTSFPRELLAEITIPEYVASHKYEVPQSRLSGDSWVLEPPGADALYDKIHGAGAPLSTYAGTSPYRGAVTGLNEAFLIDTATKNRLISEDVKSAEILAKYLRGESIGRWAAEWNETWMIVARRGINIESYPAIKNHLMQFRDRLEPRPADHDGEWPGRKAGNYRWFELQDSVEYWQMFSQPKIIYQVIQFYPRYALDRAGFAMNDKGFFIPVVDNWLLAVLNSPLMWWHNWRYLTHMKDEALTPIGKKMEHLPIAPPSDEARAVAEEAVPRLVQIVEENNDVCAAVLDSLRMQFAVDKPGQRLEDFATLDSDAFVTEVLKRRPRSAGKLKAADLKSLRAMHDDEAPPVLARRKEALGLERRLAELVNLAYGLTPDEVELMWTTAPPRMPVGR